MNSLSWLIYWADVLPNFSQLLCVIAFFTTLACCVGLLIRFFCTSSAMKIEEYKSAVADWEEKGKEGRKPDPYNYDVGRNDWDNAGFYKNLRFIPYIIPFPFLLWAVSHLVPEKDTFYMIAASEAGESIGKEISPEVTKVRTIINNWLDNQIKEQGASAEPVKES